MMPSILTILSCRELMKDSNRHGGDFVADVLQVNGLSHIFTLTGGHISPILVAASNLGITVIDTRSEVNAVFAADAYSRLSGKVGVAVVTAGPGVTNAITALKNAQMAESSLVLIGGATATMLEGRGSLQDIDQLGLLKTAVKWKTSVRKVSEIVPKLTQAFKEAQNGVPGPVFVEMPVDVLYPEAIVREWYGAKDVKSGSFMSRLMSWYINRHVNKLFASNSNDVVPLQATWFVKTSPASIPDLARRIEKAQRPVVLASSQVVSIPVMNNEIVNSLEALGLPVYLSGMARGLLGKNHPLHYKHKRTAVLKQADLIILLGTPLDFRLDYGRKLGRKAYAVSVNLSRETLRMNRSIRKLDETIVAHPGRFLIDLAATMETYDITKFDNWHAQISEMNQQREEEITKMKEVKPDKYLNPLSVCQAIEEVLQDDSIIVADGGDFVASFSYVANPRGPLQWLDPGPFGTLGVGAGFAIGSKAVRPEAPVWIIYGDGALGFSIAEFDTLVRHELPVIAIVGNDASWQQIAREQIEVFGSDLGTSLDYTPYHQVVEGFGAKGILVDSSEELSGALEEALDLYHQGYSVLINVLLAESDFRKGSISM